MHFKGRVIRRNDMYHGHGKSQSIAEERGVTFGTLELYDQAKMKIFQTYKK